MGLVQIHEGGQNQHQPYKLVEKARNNILTEQWRLVLGIDSRRCDIKKKKKHFKTKPQHRLKICHFGSFVYSLSCGEYNSTHSTVSSG